MAIVSIFEQMKAAKEKAAQKEESAPDRALISTANTTRIDSTPVAVAPVVRLTDSKVSSPPPVRPSADDVMIAAVNEEYALIEDRGLVARFNNAKLVAYQRADSFTRAKDNQRGRGKLGLGSWWLKHVNRRSYLDVRLCPPPMALPDNYYNLWQGFAVEAKQGDWSLMRAHIRDVIAAGIPELADYIIKWIAWGFQNPGLPAEAALALLGRKGTGKGTLGKALKRIYGAHAMQLSKPADFTGGNFNGHLEKAIYLWADECHWPGVKAEEGFLQSMITEDTLLIHPKNVTPYSAPNMLRILICTNSDWAVPASIDERRFVVSNVSEHRRVAKGRSDEKENRAYWKALNHEMENGGLEAMLFELLRTDLGDWHPRQVVDSEALRQQKERSLDQPKRWLLDLLQTGVLPTIWQKFPGFATSKDLQAALEKACNKSRPPQARAFGALLESVGAKDCQKGPNRARGWQFPTLAAARAAWDAAYFPMTWGTEADWS